MFVSQTHVPSSPFARVMGFASLGASLLVGTARDNAANWLSGAEEKSASKFMSEANAERLADALCRMRRVGQTARKSSTFATSPLF